MIRVHHYVTIDGVECCRRCGRVRDKTRHGPEYCEGRPPPTRELAEAEARIAELERERDELRAEVHELSTVHEAIQSLELSPAASEALLAVKLDLEGIYREALERARHHARTWKALAKRLRFWVGFTRRQRDESDRMIYKLRADNARLREALESAAALIAESGNGPNSRRQNFHFLAVDWLDRNGFDVLTAAALAAVEEGDDE